MLPVMINDVPIDCLNRAAVVHHVPAMVILSVIKMENAKNGEASINKNGTVDYGVMQINSVWLPKIAGYGYSKDDIQYNACKNVFVGTWILSQSIAESKNLWVGIGNYHSHTFSHNLDYRNSIYKRYKKLSYYIDS